MFRKRPPHRRLKRRKAAGVSPIRIPEQGKPVLLKIININRRIPYDR